MRKLCCSTFTANLVLWLIVALPREGSVHVTGNRAETILRTIAHYGILPLSFIPNAGQSESSVRFQVPSSNGTLFFKTDSVLLNLPSIREPAFPPGHIRSFPISASALWTMSTLVEITFLNPNPNTIIEGIAQLPGITNFFIGGNQTKWRANIPMYAGLIYHNLYSGIDLKYSGHTGLLKGTYLLVPGTNPAVIQWHYRGVNKISLDPKTGDLTLLSASGVKLIDQAPTAWQPHNDRKISVTIGYQIGDNGSVGFAVGNFDHKLPLIIDPGLDYSTYLGGSGAAFGNGIAVDGVGNAYVTGLIRGNLPTTAGAYQTTPGGEDDVFVSKLNATGDTLVYSTYLGGSGIDTAHGIVVDGSGNAYITGGTNGDFPTTSGAYQTTPGGEDDVFVAKLNPTGNSLLYSTRLGGSGQDEGYGIAVDGVGNAYIAGMASDHFPTTPGTILPTIQSTFGSDIGTSFVSKLNAAGTALLYSTYIGGNKGDFANAIAVDRNGNAYITGTTMGNFPTTRGAYQTTDNNDYSDHVFVSKLNAAGTALLYSTYVSGSAYAWASGIAVDESGNVYITGGTFNKFPTTFGAYQIAFSVADCYGGDGSTGCPNAFVSKLNEAGSKLDYSTYLSGTAISEGMGIIIDKAGSAYITGRAKENFPTTNDAVQIVYQGGNYDAFVSKLNTTGTSLLYSTYLGGQGDDEGRGIALDNNGSVYVTGFTDNNFPTTSDGHQTILSFGPDAFVTKLTLP